MGTIWIYARRVREFIWWNFIDIYMEWVIFLVYVLIITLWTFDDLNIWLFEHFLKFINMLAMKLIINNAWLSTEFLLFNAYKENLIVRLIQLHYSTHINPMGTSFTEIITSTWYFDRNIHPQNWNKYLFNLSLSILLIIFIYSKTE